MKASTTPPARLIWALSAPPVNMGSPVEGVADTVTLAVLEALGVMMVKDSVPVPEGRGTVSEGG